MKKAIILIMMHSCLFIRSSSLKHKVGTLQKEGPLVSSSTPYITVSKQIPTKDLMAEKIQEHSTINKSLLERFKSMYQMFILVLERKATTTVKIELPWLEKALTNFLKDYMANKSTLTDELCTQLADDIENMHKQHAREIKNLILMFKSHKDMTCVQIKTIARVEEMQLKLGNTFFSEMKRQALSQLDHSLATEKVKLKVEKKRIETALQEKKELWEVVLEQKKARSELELATERKLHEQMWMSQISEKHAQLDIEEQIQELAAQEERIRMFEELKVQERVHEIALQAEREKANQVLELRAEELNKSLFLAEEIVVKRRAQCREDIKALIKHVKIFQRRQDRYNLEIQRIIGDPKRKLKDAGTPPKYKKTQDGKSIVGVIRGVMPT